MYVGMRFSISLSPQASTKLSTHALVISILNFTCVCLSVCLCVPMDGKKESPAHYCLTNVIVCDIAISVDVRTYVGRPGGRRGRLMPAPPLAFTCIVQRSSRKSNRATKQASRKKKEVSRNFSQFPFLLFSSGCMKKQKEEKEPNIEERKTRRTTIFAKEEDEQKKNLTSLTLLSIFMSPV